MVPWSHLYRPYWKLRASGAGGSKVPGQGSPREGGSQGFLPGGVLGGENACEPTRGRGPPPPSQPNRRGPAVCSVNKLQKWLCSTVRAENDLEAELENCEEFRGRVQGCREVWAASAARGVSLPKPTVENGGADTQEKDRKDICLTADAVSGSRVCRYLSSLPFSVFCRFSALHVNFFFFFFYCQEKSKQYYF